jgi:hypothetical protein
MPVTIPLDPVNLESNSCKLIHIIIIMVNRRNQALVEVAWVAVKLYEFAEPFEKPRCPRQSTTHRLPNTVVCYYLMLNIHLPFSADLVQLSQKLSTTLV